MEKMAAMGSDEARRAREDAARSGDAARAEAERNLAERRERAMAMMMREFRIEAALVDVPKLARIVGLASSTLYGYIRAGVFFIPYRLVNGRPLVTLDDLVDWYCSGAGMEPVSGPALPDSRPIGRRRAPEPAFTPKTTAEIVAEAKAALGMEPKPRRGRQSP